MIGEVYTLRGIEQLRLNDRCLVLSYEGGFRAGRVTEIRESAFEIEVDGSKSTREYDKSRLAFTIIARGNKENQPRSYYFGESIKNLLLGTRPKNPVLRLWENAGEYKLTPQREH